MLLSILLNHRSWSKWFLPPVFSLRLHRAIQTLPFSVWRYQTKVPWSPMVHYLELISIRSSLKFDTPNFLTISHSIINML